jgi:hypothetical protein
MQFSFSLLRIKSVYMFRALLAHTQEELHKWHLVYCLRVMIDGCATIVMNCNIPSAVCLSPPEDEQVMLETCRGSWFSINWMKRASRWFHYTDTLWCTASRTLSISLTSGRRMDLAFQNSFQVEDILHTKTAGSIKGSVVMWPVCTHAT